LETEEEHQIGGDEREMEGLTLAFGRSDAGAADKHHQETVVLAGVVPGTPTNIESENPGKKWKPKMGDECSRSEKKSDVNGKDAIFGEFVVGMIGAVDGSHEVRVVEEESESVEREGPTPSRRGGDVICEKQERSGPGATTDNKIDPGSVDPRWPSARAGRGGFGSGIGRKMDGGHQNERSVVFSH